MDALIVSRDPRARVWVASALGPDWDAADAEDGLAALELAGTIVPDLVVADETTEPYGAFGLARELKLLSDPPVVIVLLERAQDTWLARWSGADRWLIRPVDPYELRTAAAELTAPPIDVEAEPEPDAAVEPGLDGEAAPAPDPVG